MTKNLIKGIVLICIVIAFTSCRREKKETLGNTITIDNSTAENLFSDLFKVANNVSQSEDGIRENGIGCIDSIYVDTLSMPRTVMIDFGTDDCVGDDGRIRKGKIHITYTGRYRDVGTIITITPDNFTSNGYLVQGSQTVTNLGENANSQLSYSVNVNGSITAPANAWSSQWTSQRTRTWVQGQNTLTWLDDVYDITGTASGVNRNGLAYTVSVTSPLRAKLVCPWIVSGTMILTPEGYDARVIDFGNGECNNAFTVTVNGETVQYGTGD